MGEWGGWGGWVGPRWPPRGPLLSPFTPHAVLAPRTLTSTSDTMSCLTKYVAPLPLPSSLSETRGQCSLPPPQSTATRKSSRCHPSLSPLPPLLTDGEPGPSRASREDLWSTFSLQVPLSLSLPLRVILSANFSQRSRRPAVIDSHTAFPPFHISIWLRSSLAAAPSLAPNRRR